MHIQKMTDRLSVLLLSSIVFTALGTIIMHYTVVHNRNSGEWPVTLFLFIASVSLLALITMVRKQRSNNVLFLKLQEVNQSLEHKMKEHAREFQIKSDSEKQLNEELRQTLEEKNNSLGTVVHDLRSPLNGILGLLNLIKFDYKDLNTEQKEYLKYIDYAVISMQNMISNLLDTNQIGQGRNVINPEKIELSGLLQRHIKIFKACADKKNITLILEDNAPSIALTTDSGTLIRILENLVSNAIKFSPRDKQVLIRIIHNHTHIKLEVIDQGPGIRKEEMAKLFNKYQRLSAQPTGGENSTGLGLSIVKELVASLQGKISVESEENKGAKFILELPLELN